MEMFSVIIPCYNLESIIQKTILNVLNQVNDNLEIIIIDDGSTDNTLKVIKDFEQKDSRIKVFSKENGGVSSARNLGIKRALGKYILFLDGDDLIEPELLERALDVLKNENVDMFSYGYKKIKERSNMLVKKYSNDKYNKMLFNGEEFQKLYFSKQINQCMCSFIIKRQIIIGNGIFFDESTKYAEDQEFQLRCNLKCENIYYESKEYFYYIQRKGSAVNQVIVRDNFEVYFRMANYLSDEIKQQYNNYLCYVFVTYVRNIILNGSEKVTVKRLLSIDHVLNNYKMDSSKYSILTGVFIILYKFCIKKYLLKKFDIK